MVSGARAAEDGQRLIDQAIDEITTTRAQLGAFQKNTLESNLQQLRITAENLVSAESTIRDSDMAAEVAEFTRNSIMVQSSTAMLAQANQ
ncbi:MAG: flagellin, partial [Candidatus Sungbacteria bacterium]|nr:flagellin [Candidatus Sungbacteria bacterium]